MSTVEEVISEACSMLNRPDLRPDMRVRARNILNKLHAAVDFERDIVQGVETALDSAGAATLSMGALVRKPFGIAVRNTDNVSYSQQFILRGVQPPRSYFGFTQQAPTYYIAGGAVFIQCVYPFPSSVRLDTLNFPAWTVNEDGTVESTSWILDNHSDVLMYKLLSELAVSVEHKTLMQTAAGQFMEAQRILELNERITTCILGA